MKLMIRAAIFYLIGASCTAFAAEQSDYSKSLSLSILYSNHESGVFTVTLKNISEIPLSLMLNTTELEGKFYIGEDKSIFICDRDYLNRLLTGVWFSGHCELDSQEEVSWKVELKELVYVNSRQPSVTKENLAGKQVFLTLDRLAVFPAQGESNVPTEAQSKSIIIQANKAEMATPRKPSD